MKNTISLVLILFCFSIGSIAENDTLTNKKLPDSLRTKNEFAWVDRLDSLVNTHFVFSRDSIPVGITDMENIITELPDSVYRVRIKAIYSPVEMSYNEQVKNNIEYYITKSYNQIPRLLALSQYYFPMFEEILDQHGLPYELKYLAVVESALNPQAVSRAGATGLWQFMYRTGKFMDLEINSYVDERRDPIASTHAACRYLKALDAIYNDWMLVLAAYNCGPGNLNRAIRRAGGTGNFWDIYHYLPRETKNYVPAFIAVSYLFNYYEEHGFYAEDIDVPHNVDTIKLNKDLHFGQLSECLDIGIDTLRYLNPQYRYDFIPGNQSPQHLILPKRVIPQYIAMEDTIHHYKDSVYLNPQKIAYKPASRATAYQPVSAAQPKGTKKLTYTIKQGDAIGLIADWYDVSTRELKAWNGLYSNRIRAGKKLVVYVPEGKYDYYKPVDNMSLAKKQKRNGLTMPSNNPEPVKLDPNYVYYTVRPGDNPWDIANKFNGISADDILRLNDISDASNLKVGQKIKIRKKS
ncbi:MAG: transglycosylase SLT domain-containing protein [Candidatus Delongbacteria bacterium]|jgi:membrane-bound lytic murein transglycosylase D|nr:transglycosylase SLT domain-containing protein [Candidatus Delongbacteria bacterium]